MSVSINGTSGVVFNDASTQNTAATGFGFKNRLFNGNMVIDQRNAGASVTPVNTQYLVDRFQAILTAASKFTVQQNAGSVTPPSGFTNYLGVTSSSAYSIGAGDIFGIGQNIEGYNMADFDFGKSTAKTITFSFWVRSSLTGTFGGSLNSSGDARSYPFNYTISAANTWEQKTVTIAGDTTGTWLTTNGTGMRVFFSIGTGSTYSGTAGSWATAAYYAPTGATSVVGTSGATFYITGVQLEKGSTATSFDYRPYGTELALCQRYYFGSASSTGVCQTSTQAYLQEYLKVQMRASPSVTFPATLTNILQAMGVGARTPSSCSAESYTGDVIVFTAGGFSGTSLATGNPIRWNGSAIQVSAEL